jgi:poly-gamma-glutamate synthesis protein (capsule biosynthesis protein)
MNDFSRLVRSVFRALAFAAVLAVHGISVTAADDAATGRDGEVRIVFVGDIMLDGGPGHLVSLGKDPFAACAQLFAGADLVVGNLECVVGDDGQRQVKPHVFKGPERSVEFLRRHFHALSLANNHTLDFGPGGVVGTLRRVREGGIATFGAGANQAESRKPLVIERKGRRIGLLGFNEFYMEDYAATADRAGNNPLVAEDLLADIATAKGKLGCDIVIPFLHWGEEGEPEPRPDQRALARKCVAAGATAVIGCHPHVTQSVETIGNSKIVYSLGNFVFDYYPDDPEESIGWVAILDFPADGSRPVGLRTIPVRMTPAGVPEPVAVPAK